MKTIARETRENTIRARRLAVLALGGIALAALSLPSSGWAQQRRVVVEPQLAERFATVPQEANLPRGIAADPERGELFVATFEPGGTNFLLRFDARDGRLLAQLALGPVPRLGLAFNPRDRKVYMASGGALIGQASRIQRVPADFGPMTAVENVALVPDLPAPAPRQERALDGTPVSITFADSPAAAPNCLDFRPRDGALFFSDSLQGAIFRIDDPATAANVCPEGAQCVRPVIQSPMLVTAQTPIGIDGLAVSADQTRLFVSNAGDDRVLMLDLDAPEPRLSVRADGIAFPDGVITGPENTLIVVGFQANRIIVLDAATGATRAELGAFLGIDESGSALGLLGPAQAARIGDQLFVTNFAPGNAGLRRFTIARIRLPAGLNPPPPAAAARP